MHIASTMARRPPSARQNKRSGVQGAYSLAVDAADRIGKIVDFHGRTPRAPNLREDLDRRPRLPFIIHVKGAPGHLPEAHRVASSANTDLVGCTTLLAD